MPYGKWKIWSCLLPVIVYINCFYFFDRIYNIKEICLTLRKSSILTALLLIRSIRTVFFSITPPVALNAVSISTAKLFCWTSGWTRCYICTTSFIWPIRTVFISITSPAHWNALLISTSELVWTAGFGSWHWVKNRQQTSCKTMFLSRQNRFEPA